MDPTPLIETARAHVLDAVADSALLLTLALGALDTVAAASSASPAYSWQEDWA